MSDSLMMAALRFATQAERLNDPKAIVLQLENVARHGGLHLMGAWRVPAKALRDDRTPYTMHASPSLPPTFLSDYWPLYQEHGRSVLADYAWRNKGAFTMTEALRIVKPGERERWIVRFFHKHGLRDVFYVPNGAWMVVYWAPKVLRLDSPSRAALQLAAGAAAARLGRLTRERDGELMTGLSGRQRAVLRLVGQGYSLQEVANYLGIKYGTAQEHAQRAMKKLGAKNLTHAAAEAIRRYIVVGLATSAAAVAIFEVYDICCWDAIVRLWT